MKGLSIRKVPLKRWHLSAISFATCMTISERLYAAPTDPWDQAVAVLQTAFTGPIATAALVNSLGTFSGPVLMEYNYEGRTLPHLPVCLDFKNGKLYPNERPGLGVELGFQAIDQDR